MPYSDTSGLWDVNNFFLNILLKPHDSVMHGCKTVVHKLCAIFSGTPCSYGLLFSFSFYLVFIFQFSFSISFFSATLQFTSIYYKLHTVQQTIHTWKMLLCKLSHKLFLSLSAPMFNRKSRLDLTSTSQHKRRQYTER